MDFTRDMVMQFKKEDHLPNKDNKQRFIRMLGQVKDWNTLDAKHVRVVQMS